MPWRGLRGIHVLTYTVRRSGITSSACRAVVCAKEQGSETRHERLPCTMVGEVARFRSGVQDPDQSSRIAGSEAASNQYLLLTPYRTLFPKTPFRGRAQRAEMR
jgi:hypothetical protein